MAFGDDGHVAGGVCRCELCFIAKELGVPMVLIEKKNFNGNELLFKKCKYVIKGKVAAGLIQRWN